MSIITSLSLKNIEFQVYLGWPEIERRTKQKISIDIELQFQNPPKACRTDDLNETICYDQLIRNLNEHLGERPFKLIEYLGKELYDYIKQQFSREKTSVNIRITKQPPISNLIGGASFCYGDGSTHT